MKTDTYTKFILTIIAGALLYMCVQKATSPPIVSAQTLSQNEQRVVITGYLSADGSVIRPAKGGLPVSVVK